MMRKQGDERLFTELLRSALWGTAIGITALRNEQYEEVMIVARRQRMEAIIGDVLMRQQVSLDRPQVAHLLAVIKTTEQENRKKNRLMTAYTEDLCQHGIRYHVVKGQAIGAYYPSPLMRTSGDIDIFFPKESYVAAVTLAEKQGMTMCKGNERGKHKVMIKEGVVFELHRRLLLLATSRHRKVWKSLMDECRLQEANIKIDDFKVSTLPVMYHLVYVFMHLYFHLITSGVGIRQLCDMAVLLKRGEQEGIDWLRVIRIVDTLGCLKAFRAVLACCVEALGLSVEVPVVLRDSDYRWGRLIYRRIMRGGNFGCELRRVQSAGWLHRLETAWLVLGNVIRFRWLILEMLSFFGHSTSLAQVSKST